MEAVHEPPDMKPATMFTVIYSSWLIDLRADNIRINIKIRVTSPRITEYGVTDVTRMNCFYFIPNKIKIQRRKGKSINFLSFSDFILIRNIDTFIILFLTKLYP
jgi:hypothetical protein